MQDSEASGHSLVSSDDVVGTEVYNTSGEHIGAIDHVMIDKISGKIAYAVMGFGGVLGIGEEHYPVPWAALRYEVSQGGFVTDVTPEQLENAPRRDDGWYGSRDWEIRTHDNYGIPYYWI
ncbi:photosystem reaction center subunit H (plasmid) [Gemmobacter aquarius]|uniref:Photosystem reaction center subunit H n=1 Tax=Paragemmobacter aquarius TaxID=2169400 RepID=A0A2S0US37_9RHOB|nr:PRC-barrel domain-containing protein [Gemmobacter aquarius]AWB50617.1 photosystem reaction center subunit H [Gemmobacter aquarius]